MKKKEKKITDRMRMDWLEKYSNAGGGLVNDDNGHWAFVWDGIQPVPMKSGAIDMPMTLFVEKKQWKTSARKAIDMAMKKN
jgi:hypothetical protein